MRIQRTVFFVAPLAALMLAPSLRCHEGAAQKQRTPTQAALGRWNDIGNELITPPESRAKK